MNIMVFGATRGTGRIVVDLALAAGHRVTAVARNPLALSSQHPNLRVIHGNVLDAASFAPFMRGQDAVVSTLGITDLKPTVIYSQGIGNVMAAMGKEGVSRIVCLSADVFDPSPFWLMRYVMVPMLWRIMGNNYRDLGLMEDLLRASRLQWTVVRPPRLTDKAAKGRYRFVINGHQRQGFSIARADVAQFMVSHLDDEATFAGVVTIAD